MRRPGVTSLLQQIPREVSVEPMEGHEKEGKGGGMNDWDHPEPTDVGEQ